MVHEVLLFVKGNITGIYTQNMRVCLEFTPEIQ